MAKNKISEYSATPADNTDISNINIAEGCSPANVNNAIRSLMAQIKDLQAGTSGDTIPLTAGGTGSATATDARTALSAAKSGANSDITSMTGLTTPLSVSQGGTGVQITRTISNVALTSNVVTITTSAAHGYLANDSVTVTATTQTTVNGTYTIISVPASTSFTYAKTASNISSIADTGSVVSSSNIKMSAASGTLSVSNGGTGTSTLKLNNLFLGNGTSSPTLIPAGTTNNVLRSTSTSTVTAGSFAVGTEYTILTVGTTDFTGIGASANTVGIVFTATGAGSGTGTATTNTWTSSSLNLLTSDTAKASTSGTSIDFTSIPSWVKRITVMFSGVSTNGSSSYQVQIGSGSVETSGYVGNLSETPGTGAGSTIYPGAGFVVSRTNTSTLATSGHLVLTNITSNTWVGSSLMAASVGNVTYYGAGNKSIGGTLDQVRITTVNGTDTFDAGTINIMYE
jgi:hypothetical protein